MGDQSHAPAPLLSNKSPGTLCKGSYMYMGLTEAPDVYGEEKIALSWV
jgi:hypothetical protein